MQEHFVAAHQQVGDFEAVNIDGKIKKNGGNVASYFCTPDGRVIQAVVGPVNKYELLREAKWAVETYATVKDTQLESQWKRISEAHVSAMGHGWSLEKSEPHAWRHGGNRAQRIHQLLATKPLAPIATVYEEIFHHILGQKISKAAPNLAMAAQQLDLAEKTGRPLLFVIHREHDNSRAYQKWLEHVKSTRVRDVPLHVLLREHVVVILPLKELPALSHRLERPPFEAPDRGTPLFVIARSDGEQISAVTGWNKSSELMHQLAAGMIDYVQMQQPSILQLRRIQRTLGKLDQRYIQELKEIILRETARIKVARQETLASAAR